MEPEFSNGTQFPSNSVPDSILTIPVVPAELITEILLRLPVKPLLKFRKKCAGYYEYRLNCGGLFVDGKLHWDTYIYDPEFDPVEY
ncbi:hypothetical protein KY289_012312 [Solanum tuberosum]|nr:hypothetical protein KY289_012312 [Solanum tuberosum]